MNTNKNNSFSTLAKICRDTNALYFYAAYQKNRWIDGRADNGYSNSPYGTFNRLNQPFISVSLDNIKGYTVPKEDRNYLSIYGNFNTISPGCEMIIITTDVYSFSFLIKDLLNFPGIASATRYASFHKWFEHHHSQAPQQEQLAKKVVCRQCGGEIVMDTDYQQLTALGMNAIQAIGQGISLLSGAGMSRPWKTARGSERLKCIKCGKVHK